jgi:hypothetical protein
VTYLDAQTLRVVSTLVLVLVCLGDVLNILLHISKHNTGCPITDSGVDRHKLLPGLAGQLQDVHDLLFSKAWHKLGKGAIVLASLPRVQFRSQSEMHGYVLRGTLDG